MTLHLMDTLHPGAGEELQNRGVNTIRILTLHSNPDLDVSRGTRELLFDFEFNNGYSLEFEDSIYQPIEIGI